MGVLFHKNVKIIYHKMGGKKQTLQILFSFVHQCGKISKKK